MSTSVLVGLIEQTHVELVARECRVLELAAAWADRHNLDPTGRDYHPLVERACAYGGEGTPEVSEYCAAELGALQGIEHQHDQDSSEDPHEQPQEPQDEPAEASGHLSLSMQPPPEFDATAARPRVVLHFHLTEEAVRHGNGLVRP